MHWSFKVQMVKKNFPCTIDYFFWAWVSTWLGYWPYIAAPRTNFNVEDEKKTVQYAEIRPQQWKLDDSGRNSRKEPKTTLWRILKTGDDDNDFATKHIENTSRIWQNNTSTRALSSRGLGTILLKHVFYVVKFILCGRWYYTIYTTSSSCDCCPKEQRSNMKEWQLYLTITIIQCEPV